MCRNVDIQCARVTACAERRNILTQSVEWRLRWPRHNSEAQPLGFSHPAEGGWEFCPAEGGLGLLPGARWVALTDNHLLWGGGRRQRHPTVTGVFHTAKPLLCSCDVPPGTGTTLRNGDIILRDQHERRRVDHPDTTCEEGQQGAG